MRRSLSVFDDDILVLVRYYFLYEFRPVFRPSYNSYKIESRLSPIRTADAMPYKCLEKHKAYMRQWREENSEKNHRSHTISEWKRNGVIHDDYNALYDQYMATTNCADCGVVLGKKGDGSGTFKSLDHCHETGAFRAVVCTGCNRRRGVVDKMLRS